ncbi:tRNA guanosine(34) transglycosylase Tgt [Candidatus Marinamargulisbacteria bacterium SCGC AG-333-B06]|nr:tRNA guanosine(34) transglycosylase Tgt [Candidatus Marinamargulisbacteria bacterium SCGC AG-333-B06]
MIHYSFTIKQRCSKTNARLGELRTPHGILETPVFMPVGTQATIKSLTPDQIISTKSQILLANTYHLSLRPGIDIIKKHGGLHSMMNWHGPILTDSGGYQVFSLAKRRQVDPNGITFQSHIDGSLVRFTPKHVIDLQCGFNSDIMMVLDICTAYGKTKEQTARDLILTHQWAKESQQYWFDKHIANWCFAIVQGGFYMDLRKESADFLSSLNFPGYAIGGLSVGEPQALLHDYITNCAPLLPDNKPRYVMGIGLPENIKVAIENGIDMFDCVIPTRIARHGQFFHENERINIKKEMFKDDLAPLSDHCSCYTCQHFSRSYIRHLFIAKEMLAATLLTIHNIFYLNHYVEMIKNKIFNNS